MCMLKEELDLKVGIIEAAGVRIPGILPFVKEPSLRALICLLGKKTQKRV